jgi:hypothetical protein
MFRVPIVSRGYTIENGTSQIVFTAELPSEERYEISEVGVYSAGSNPSAVGNDSRTILSFNRTENWQVITGSGSVPIPVETNSIETDSVTNTIKSDKLIFQTASDNPGLYGQLRKDRYEVCRFSSNVVLIYGNTSPISGTSGSFSVTSSDPYIQLDGISMDFTKNSLTDELRLAYSVVNKVGNATLASGTTLRAKIYLQFITSDLKVAKFESVSNLTDSSRYDVAVKELQDLIFDDGFSWSTVNKVKINAAVYTVTGGVETISSNHLVALDALRFENTTTTNPIYGLTGYSIVQTSGSKTLIKKPNTSNLIEFRFNLDVTQ